ncbi:MAG: cation-translocating P-type ATPase [Sediminicola sp.]
MDNFGISGLTEEEVLRSRALHGSNRLGQKSENNFLEYLVGLAKEPMVVILLVAASIYFISGQTGDGLFLSIAILFVASISVYQDSRSKKALKDLKDLTQPIWKVYRNGSLTEVPLDDLVVGDSLIVEEGNTVPADGSIVHSNDLSVNESMLTGESLPVYKRARSGENLLYTGTNVTGGLAIMTITAIGNATELGKIGKSLDDIEVEKTPLARQIDDFVKKMVVLGAVFFLGVWGINYYRNPEILDSLLKALTLAMSILPEEIPVAFTTFMALGAWRLMKMGIIVKRMATVESLGNATVICTDKTGTITQNKMELARLYIPGSPIVTYTDNLQDPLGKELLRIAMWASEPIPFDPMEIAIHQGYVSNFQKDERPLYKLVHEYPLGGNPPMMTHIQEDEKGHRIIAAKGAPEAFLEISDLGQEVKNHLINGISSLASQGFRLLGVALATMEGESYPAQQQQFHFNFLGMVAFYDPPKPNIREVFEKFGKAGIAIKIITGDNAETTKAIASQIGFDTGNKSLSGSQLMALSDDELKQTVGGAKIFTRMFPEAKLRIINALKANGEIVAMTGDGVNDGPALKAAHIGIAMGKKGTEVAKAAAALILVEDDLSKMVDAIAMGRRIHTNLKKAIQYVISIHIPIVLIVFLPLALNWAFPHIFTPIHVILLELIMGPTCSILYENEPLEKNTMAQMPRPFSIAFFNNRELITSLLQGLAITLGALAIYQFSVGQGWNEPTTRALVFTNLITANIFLTLVNRSFIYPISTTITYKNALVPLMIGATILLTAALLYMEPLADFFKFEGLSPVQLGSCAGVGFLSVVWYEAVKAIKRSGKTKTRPLNRSYRK